MNNGLSYDGRCGGWVFSDQDRVVFSDRQSKILGVSKVSVCRYERNCSKPNYVVTERLRKVFKLSGELDRFS